MAKARTRTILLTLAVAACAGAETSGTMQLDVPDEAKAELNAGAPAATYVYYALAESPPAGWEDFQTQGLWICDDRPPLIPREIVAMIDGGGFVGGTQLQLTTEDFESATKGRVKSALEMKFRVSIGITFQGCIKTAIKDLGESPGGVLLTERDADFEGKDKLAEVSFQ